MIDKLYTRAKSAAAAVGVAATLGTSYVATGLPIPASQAFVRAEVASVSGKIDGLALGQLELQHQQILDTRARLRSELAANNAQRAKVAAAYRLTLDRRSAEISDELAGLDRKDQDLTGRIGKMRGG